MKEYYDTRAPEYDDWYLGRGLFAERDRPKWDEELEQLFAVIRSLPPVPDRSVTSSRLRRRLGGRGGRSGLPRPVGGRG